MPLVDGVAVINENGSVVTRKKLKVSEKIYFVAAIGYELDGAADASCTQNGSLDVGVPVSVGRWRSVD